MKKKETDKILDLAREKAHVDGSWFSIYITDLEEILDSLRRPVGRPMTSVAIDRAKLRKLRKEKGLRQQDLARALGYTDARVTQFETGSAGDGIPVAALKVIADTLEVNYRVLMARTKE